jgi:transcription antitermination factor NusG
VSELGSPDKCDLEGEAMGTTNILLDPSRSISSLPAAPENWYALHTRPRHEKIVTEIHRWSDRKKKVEAPLFSCYVFAKFVPNRAERLRVLRVDGVFSLVGAQGEGAPIPDDQIDAIRGLVEAGLPWTSHPYLKIGQRVRIRSGALDGMEGILLSCNGDQSLVISIDAIQRSLAVRVDGYQVEAA